MRDKNWENPTHTYKLDLIQSLIKPFLCEEGSECQARRRGVDGIEFFPLENSTIFKGRFRGLNFSNICLNFGVKSGKIKKIIIWSSSISKDSIISLDFWGNSFHQQITLFFPYLNFLLHTIFGRSDSINLYRKEFHTENALNYDI